MRLFVDLRSTIQISLVNYVFSSDGSERFATWGIQVYKLFDFHVSMWKRFVFIVLFVEASAVTAPIT